jgi:oxepin-CoA hydrolase/3-oxo-5,6-dehydrosuberyl-CoA semialdehyde dehydrogenase
VTPGIEENTVSAPLLESYLRGRWQAPSPDGVALPDAVTGDVVARISAGPVDVAGMVDHARSVGGPALRALNFQERAAILKQVALALMADTADFAALSRRTGATDRDTAVDVDGGIGTMLAYASRGRRELPADTILLDGPPEQLGKQGTFVGQHVFTPLRGVAVQINAFNFPVWGFLEKFAPAFLAGVPSIVKPASPTAYLTEAVVRRMVDSALLPEGTLQLLVGRANGVLDQLGGQDLVAFTGSAATAATLRSHPAVSARGMRFNAEADSLNCSVLGPDVTPDAPEFGLYVDQLVTEMTVKAGQKCTAIRRALVPTALVDHVVEAVRERLRTVVVGNPANPDVGMGALASRAQRDEVRRAVETLSRSAKVVVGDPHHVDVVDADADRGAFLAPILLRGDDPDAPEPHDVEAFGPVSTVLPYTDIAHAADLAVRGQGSLVGSLVTHDPAVARTFLLETAHAHGRLLVLNRDDAAESTGHGTPMPMLVHGGPGRAGGGEELGGLRAVHHYLQRTAVQAPPGLLAAIGLSAAG